jgi:hypothetical protein
MNDKIKLEKHIKTKLEHLLDHKAPSVNIKSIELYINTL